MRPSERAKGRLDAAWTGYALTLAAATAATAAVAVSDGVWAIAVGALLAAIYLGASTMERRGGFLTHAGSAALAGTVAIFVAVWAVFGLAVGLWLLVALGGLLVILGVDALLQRPPAVDDGGAQRRTIRAAETEANAVPVSEALLPSKATRSNAPASRESTASDESPAPRPAHTPLPAPDRARPPRRAAAGAASPARPQPIATPPSSRGTSEVAWIARLTWVTLRTMRDMHQPAHNNEIDDAVASAMGVSVQARLHMRSRRDGHSEWGYRVGWARSALHNRRWIERPSDGWWRVTSRGAAATEEDVTMHARQYFATKRELEDYAPLPLPGLDTDDDASQSALSATPTLHEQLMAQLWALAPICFEELCAEVLRNEGYSNVRAIGGRGDDGIDILAELRGPTGATDVYVQCKAWRGEVGVEVVRDVQQALYRRAKRGRSGPGRLMTTGYFSRDAIETAARRRETPLELTNGNDLCALLAKHEGVVIEWSDDLEVNRRWFESFAQNCQEGDRYKNPAWPTEHPLQPDPRRDRTSS